MRLNDPRDDKARIEQTKGGLLRDSYRWILYNSDFQRWCLDPGSRLLWIKGDAGKGKTMLLCGIIDELERITAVEAYNGHLAYFFCQVTDLRSNNATAVLRGLIYLLIDQQPSLLPHLRKKYDLAGKPLFEGLDAWVALSDIFENILRDPSLHTTYLVIDALDECVADLPNLLDFIVRVSSSATGVKWLISSRNWPYIEKKLGLDDEQTRLSLDLKGNAEQISLAVDAYIDNKLSRLEALRDDGLLRGQVRDILRQKANGTFLWVALVVQELERAQSWDILEVVDEIPADLAPLYDRMLNQIEQLPRRNPKFCKLTLSATTVAYRPLRLAEIGGLSGLPEQISGSTDKVGEIVAMCSSFLTVRDDQVYFIHQSAKDYLQANYTSIQPAGVAQGHTDISRRSIDAMSTILKRNIYNLDFGFKPKDMRPPQPDPLAPIRYSCVFWADHLSLNVDAPECKRALTDDGAVFKFLKERFLHWLESLSLMGKLSDGVLSMRKLLHVVQVCS